MAVQWKLQLGDRFGAYSQVETSSTNGSIGGVDCSRSNDLNASRGMCNSCIAIAEIRLVKSRTSVEYPLGKAVMNAWAFASRAASSTSSCIPTVAYVSASRKQHGSRTLGEEIQMSVQCTQKKRHKAGDPAVNTMLKVTDFQRLANGRVLKALKSTEKKEGMTYVQFRDLSKAGAERKHSRPLRRRGVPMHENSFRQCMRV